MYDLIIKGGTIVDGSGQPGYTGDIAIQGHRIAEVGRVTATSKRTINADGLLVTPGWVDIHTHYDGQATWDPVMAPSIWNGVTTAVMGNCGVGFAPVRRDRHDWLIALMEGVEDIPGTALADGLKWDWESFPEYLDALERQPRTLHVASQVAHGALRAYVMDERGAANEPATDRDIEQMAKLLREAMVAGALGVSTSRTMAHRAIDGRPVPGTFAAEQELRMLAATVARYGGIMEVAPAGLTGDDLSAPAQEINWMSKISAETGCPITFLLVQHGAAPDAWRETLDLVDAAVAGGARIYPQVYGRPVNTLYCFRATHHPFSRMPSYAAVANLPPDERIAALRNSELRARLLAEDVPIGDPKRHLLGNPWEAAFALGNPPIYEPDPENSIAAIARRQNRPAKEVGYDMLLSDDGNQVLMHAALGFANGHLGPLLEMMKSPHTVMGGSDAGAHCRAISDAAIPTFMLTHWARDRAGERIALEEVVRKQTSQTADVFGLKDRGRLAPGMMADLNLIDFENLKVHAPYMLNDLPTGVGRFVQNADGYVSTIVAGQSVRENGEDTGARPGHVIRRGRESVA